MNTQHPPSHSLSDGVTTALGVSLATWDASEGCGGIQGTTHLTKARCTGLQLASRHSRMPRSILPGVQLLDVWVKRSPIRRLFKDKNLSFAKERRRANLCDAQWKR